VLVLLVLELEYQMQHLLQLQVLVCLFLQP
jgi:hypothetical protein